MVVEMREEISTFAKRHENVGKIGGMMDGEEGYDMRMGSELLPERDLPFE